MTPAAERQRETRRRKKAGAMRIRIDVFPLFIDLLTERGWLKAWDEKDPHAVAAAVEDFHRDSIKDVTT